MANKEKKDPRNILKSKFEVANRYDNFGNALMRIHAQGFRCHVNTLIEIKSPITAFCGLNGVGKSTLIQLASAAYLGQSQQETYYISSFINVHKFDPKPFQDEAKVEYKYWQEDRELKQTTLSRKNDGGWSDYRRRPKRKVLYVGVGSYLPKVDKSDFIVRYPKEVKLLHSKDVDSYMKEWICKILGKEYQQIQSHEFQFRKKKDTVNSVQQSGIEYSEPHMGYGEARSQYLIRVIEALPDKSSIVLEEPEISLHPSAQYQFGCYLIDAAIRKGHQIFLTTHSESLLSALPSNSRVYLHKTDKGITPIPGLTAAQAHSLMSEGYSKALTVLVEDKVAKCILTEIIRQVDGVFLNSAEILPVGDCELVKKVIGALKDTKFKVACVLDGDQEPTPKENIFALPATQKQHPEGEIFNNKKVEEHISENYGLSLRDFKAANLSNVNHHCWFEKLAEKVSLDEMALIVELSRIYVKSLPESDVSTLVALLKEAIQ